MKTKLFTLVTLLSIFIFAQPSFAGKMTWQEEEKLEAEGVSVSNSLIIKTETPETSTEINWEEGYIEVAAAGTAVNCQNEAVCYIQAEETARTRAYKLMAETLEGLTITGNTILKDEIFHASITEKTVKAFIQGARVIETKQEQLGDGSYKVTVHLGKLLTSKKGIASVVYPALQEEAKKEKTNKAEEKAFVPTAAIAEPIVSEEYSSLIVDAAGFNAKPAMSPKIVTDIGEVVYGLMKVDPALVIKYGVAAYAHSLENAKKLERTGDNPLIIKGKGVAGKLQADIIISPDDATKVLLADKKTGFLNKCAVIFVMD